MYACSTTGAQYRSKVSEFTTTEMFENCYYNDNLIHKDRNILYQKKVTNHNKADSKRLKNILDPSSLFVGKRHEDFFCSKLLSSFLEILTRGNIY